MKKWILFFLLGLVFMVFGWGQQPELVLPIGHLNRINAVAFSPDNQWVLSGSSDRTTKLWDIRTGREIRTFEKEAFGVEAIAVSPNSQWVASVIFTGIRLWDVRTGEEIRWLPGIKSDMNAIAFSPNGQWIIGGSSDGNITLWSAYSGKVLHTFRGYSTPVKGVDFSKDGKWLLTVSSDSTARMWDTRTGAAVRTFTGHRSEVRAVAFSPDGQYVLTGSNDQTTRLWNLQRQELATMISLNETDWIVTSPSGLFDASKGAMEHLHFVKGLEIIELDQLKERYHEPGLLAKIMGFQEGSVRSVPVYAKPDEQIGQKPELVVQTGHRGMSAAAFSPDGKYILIGGGGRIPKLWGRSGLEIQSFIGHRHNSYIQSVAFSPDGTRVLTAGSFGQCILWDLQGRILSKFIGGSNAVAFSPDGQSILTTDGDGAVLLWDLYGRELQRLEGHGNGILEATFSPNGQKILSGDGFGVVRLWDLQGQVQELQSSQGKQGYIKGVAFSPDGKAVWAAEYKGSIKSWDLQGRELYGFKVANDKTISWAVFSPDGERAVVQSFTPFKGRTTKLWGLNGKELLDFQDPDVSSATFSPDGRMVLTTRYDGTALLWDLQGKKLQTFQGHRSSVNSVAFSPAGDRILMGNEDGTARLFDLRNLSLQSFKGHENAVTSAVFSPDGKTVLTGSMDATARLWNLTGQEILQTPGHDEAVWSVAFSPYGQKILVGSGGQYGVATLWNLQGEKIHSLESHGSAVTSVAFSPNGQKMLTGSWDETAKLWDLQGREIRTFKHDSGLLSGAFSPDGQYVAAGSSTGWDARLWDLQGNELQSFEGHFGFINSIAFSQDGQSILTGSEDMTAKLWGLDGREIRSFEGHKEAVTSALFSPDSKLLLTGSGDGTAQLTDSNTGEMLVTLYAISDVKDLWLLVNPENYYMGSRDIQGFVHFKIGLKPYLFEQFDLRLNRPDKVLETLNPYGVVDSFLMLQYRQAYHKRLEKYDFTEAMLSDDYHVPECAITNTDQLPITTKEGRLQLDIEALDTLRLLDRLNVFVNDVPIYGIQGVNLRQDNTQSYRTTLNIPLSRGPNKIQVSALNQGGAESLKTTTYITYEAPETKPDLYLIAIGVSEYQAEGKDLQYAAKDALDIAGLYRSAEGFNVVHIKTLINNQVTKTNIRTLRSWLEQSRVDDQVLLYVSGHGLIDDNYNFYYATHDIDFANPAGKGILYDEIEGLLDGIPARKKLLLMDACHSGELDQEAPPLTAEQQQSLAQKGVSFQGFTKGDDDRGPTLGLQNSFELMQQLFADLRRGSGATVITSSAGVQVSYEDADWQNGAFTYAFLYGLKSMQADANGDGQVTASEIQAFVAEYVPRLTEGLQVPTFRRENLEFDFRVW